MPLIKKSHPKHASHASHSSRTSHHSTHKTASHSAASSHASHFPKTDDHDLGSLRKIAPAMESSAGLGEDIDSRQKFYQMMSEKIKTADTSEPERVELTEEEINIKPIKAYRKMAIRFIVLAVILVLVVAYFALIKLTIVVTPQKQTLSDSVAVEVYGNTLKDASTAVKGVITRIEAEENGTFSATGIKVEKEEIAGKVKLINNYGKDQPLVASTRLLSADNKLFRLKKTVTIPANSSVEAEVYADKVSQDMAIASTKFTIPGLWAGLQDKIYAESSVAFAYGTSGKKFVEQADLDKAAKELNDKLVEKVKQRVGTASGSYDQVLYDNNLTSVKVEADAKVGDMKDQFNVKIKNVINVISFSSEEAAKVIKTKLNNPNVAEIDKASLAYNLESYNSLDNIANIKIKFSAQALSDKTNLIDKEKLVNLNEAQVSSYLKNIKEIGSFELKFFPSFIKRAPSLADRIVVEVK